MFHITFLYNTSKKQSQIHKQMFNIQPTMGLASFPNSIALLIFNSCFCLVFCAVTDTITPTQFIKDPESITSSGSIFKLGFFSPSGSTNRYVGIWYNQIPVSTIIWVANRDKPLKDSSGVVTISEEGNLLVSNGQNEILWSSNVSNPATYNTSAQLSDSGMLILQEGDSNNGSIIWESFKHPCDSFLSAMRLGVDKRTGEKLQLTSWKSPSDPSIGSFSAGIDPLNVPEFIIWNGSARYYRSGQWNGQVFIGTPHMNPGLIMEVDNEGTYLTYTSFLLNFVLNSQGQIVRRVSNDGKENWAITWLAPTTECDVYGKCGAFGSCNTQNSPICSCLRGFEPKNEEEWSRRNWTSGCVRKTKLKCERIKSGGEKGKEDGFLKLKMMKVPYFGERSPAHEDRCGSQCLNNCSCLAYGYYSGIGCMLWSGNLIDLQEFSFGGADVYLRLADSELDEKNRDIKVIVTIAVIIGTIIIAICTYFSWMWMTKRSAKMERGKVMLMFNRGEASPSFPEDYILRGNTNQTNLKELPLFDLENLATATNNFHISNKLGQGGFGPVYRGKLLDGRQIAVKRLSRASGQGLEEFMNEVVVISKLQHRNLVRLLGCCVEGEEKMLIYEYMPNKSLDAFLFDPCKRVLLDWRKRFTIIEGIGRGLLYLHRDSRLRIIHRDLKASNILLDEELNPKISDFGLARIFGSNQDQADTRRVAGTFGYMSPEYVMEGRFSEKSDVFSFGVLLLEIVSGRKNTSFYNDEHSLSLLGFAWKLWNEDNTVTLIDPAIFDSCFQVEICRCIHMGLLCVQEFAKDRPTVSTVLSMLNSEIANLPKPKQPAFIERLNASDTESSQQSRKRSSINNVTITNIDGR